MGFVAAAAFTPCIPKSNIISLIHWGKVPIDFIVGEASLWRDISCVLYTFMLPGLWEQFGFLPVETHFIKQSMKTCLNYFDVTELNRKP